MTEAEYIDATDLCKARMALVLLREYLGGDAARDKLAREARSAVAQLVASLEDVVATTE